MAVQQPFQQNQMSELVHIVCPHCHIINRLPSSRLIEKPKCGKCQQALFSGQPITLDQSQFDRHIKNNDIPVLVDFWADWCGPCKAMAPHFQSAAQNLEPNVRLVKVNIDSAQELASRYGIQSIPTLVLFKHGKEIARNSGAMGSSDLVNWINNLIR